MHANRLKLHEENDAKTLVEEVSYLSAITMNCRFVYYYALYSRAEKPYVLDIKMINEKQISSLSNFLLSFSFKQISSLSSHCIDSSWTPRPFSCYFRWVNTKTYQSHNLSIGSKAKWRNLLVWLNFCFLSSRLYIVLEGVLDLVICTVFEHIQMLRRFLGI